MSVVVEIGGKCGIFYRRLVFLNWLSFILLGGGCYYFINLMGYFAPSVLDARMPINAWNCLPLRSNQC